MIQEDNDIEIENKGFIVHRYFSWCFMLDATEYKENGIAHFMVAFGKETVFHAKYIVDDNYIGYWFLKIGSQVLALSWDDMIIKIKELIDESETMGLVVQKHELLSSFDQVFQVDRVLAIL